MGTRGSFPGVKAA